MNRRNNNFPACNQFNLFYSFAAAQMLSSVVIDVGVAFFATEISSH